MTEFEREVYNVYIETLGTRSAEEEILQDQMSIVLDTIAAADALRHNKTTKSTPKEIADVVNRRLALQESRRRIKLLTWGSSPDRADQRLEELPGSPTRQLSITDGSDSELRT